MKGKIKLKLDSEGIQERKKRKKRHLGVNAEKYPYTKEISPLNEEIQAEHLEHARMNKPWYVESHECLPQGCTQLRARQHSGRLENREKCREESREALSKEWV